MKHCALHQPEPECPKRMVYGPCGGVRQDLTCEMLPTQPCPFAHRAPVRWIGSDDEPERTALTTAMQAAGFATTGGDLRAGSLLALARERPIVLTDFTVRPYDPSSVADVTQELAGSCDAVLVGEHNNRPDFPPALLVPMIRNAGGRE